MCGLSSVAATLLGQEGADERFGANFLSAVACATRPPLRVKQKQNRTVFHTILRIGINPSVFQVISPFFHFFVHYFLETVTREPPHYTKKGDYCFLAACLFLAASLLFFNSLLAL